MNHRLVAFAVSFVSIGMLSATVIPKEELEANKPRLQPTKTGSDLLLNWTAQPEVYYFMEASPDLSTWVSAKLLKDSDKSGSLSLGTAMGSSKKFYRLSLEGDPDSARLRADDDDDKIINVLEADAGEDAFEPASSEDDDTDSIPDDWERFYFGTLDHDASYIPVEGGLTLAEAYAAGTDPNEIDSDGDGWTDMQEIEWGWDPNYDQSRDDGKYSRYGDFNGNGISNQSAILNGSSPVGSSNALNGLAIPSYALIDLGEGVGPMQVSNEGHVLYYEQETFEDPRGGPYQAATKSVRDRFGVKVSFDLGKSSKPAIAYHVCDMNNKGELLLVKSFLTINGSTYSQISYVKVGADGVSEALALSELGDYEEHENYRILDGKINDDFDYLLNYYLNFRSDQSCDSGLSQPDLFEYRYFLHDSISGNKPTGNCKWNVLNQSTCEVFNEFDYERFTPRILTNQKTAYGDYYSLSGNSIHGVTVVDHSFTGPLTSLPTTPSYRYDAINHNGLRIITDENVLFDGETESIFPPSLTKDGLRGLTSPEDDKTPLVIFNSSIIAVQKAQVNEQTGMSELVPLGEAEGAFQAYSFEEMFYQHDANGQPTINSDWDEPRITDMSDENGFIACSASKDGVEHALLLLKVEFEEVTAYTGFDDNDNQIGAEPNPALMVPLDGGGVISPGSNDVKVVAPSSLIDQITLKSIDTLAATVPAEIPSGGVVTVNAGFPDFTEVVASIAGQDGAVEHELARLYVDIKPGISDTRSIHVFNVARPGEAIPNGRTPAEIKTFLDQTWGAQANVYFTMPVQQADRTLNYDTNGVDGLLVGTGSYAEIQKLTINTLGDSGDINVFFVEKLEARGNALGFHFIDIGKSYIFIEAGQDIDITAHEFGHALGLNGVNGEGHSLNQSDVMAGKSPSTPRRTQIRRSDWNVVNPVSP